MSTRKRIISAVLAGAFTVALATPALAEGGTTPPPAEKCNSGNGNGSEATPETDCDPGNSGGHNNGKD